MLTKFLYKKKFSSYLADLPGWLRCWGNYVATYYFQWLHYVRDQPKVVFESRFHHPPSILNLILMTNDLKCVIFSYVFATFVYIAAKNRFHSLCLQKSVFVHALFVLTENCGASGRIQWVKSIFALPIHGHTKFWIYYKLCISATKGQRVAVA